MRVYGVDFTSRPGRRKPITCAACWLESSVLAFERLESFVDFAGFEDFLTRPGPWIGGFDFPFAQPRRFVENVGWPGDWAGMVRHAGGLSRAEFRAALEAYKRDRAPGDREHQRVFEAGTGAASPQKLYGVPVALMFFEGAPRLLTAGVDLPGLHFGDPARIAFEAYPGVLARRLIGRQSYKSDDRRKDTKERRTARQALFETMCGPALIAAYGLTIEAPVWLADAPGADGLDALICAVQAAWAGREVLPRPERLSRLDQLEGWIADPRVFARLEC